VTATEIDTRNKWFTIGITHRPARGTTEGETVTTNKAHATIDLDDVRRAGGVYAALLKWAEASDTTSAGTVGPEFSTSGPGNGWSVTHDANDFARRAFEGGALYYLDESDGRLASAVRVEQVEPAEGEAGYWTGDDGEEYGPDDVTHDGSGGWVLIDPEWSDESVVRLEVPDIEDAIEYPEIVAEMVRAVIDRHGSASDRAGWKKLVEDIKSAAESLDGIDPADLDD
jgi:hypothetical protein